MSKSDTNQNGYILLMDEDKDILKKFKRAVTDSEMKVCYAEGKEGVNNLMRIYAAATGKTLDEITAEFDGRGYGDFKAAVGEAVVALLAPIREKTKEYLADRAFLEKVYRDGAERANEMAQKTLSDVYDKVGFVRR